ncbi:outer membrane beta-barrel protein [Polaribacter sp. MSW13]|uniref:Outer membrane beta-barrel protein n=1 Tax=Polaribacter marinus TaxID=2916838 RepID=A0A9X2AIS0_9FLAO|nr:outer membrane beta-barrel protein [Polaribacter marinus]MCI2228372.1 outer membrane beta-barrel protein [Polaribacter marinus]
MKKLLFIAVFAICGLGTANAQEGAFNVGGNLGFPTGDMSDISSFAISVEANYLFNLSDEFKVGPSVSYLHYFGKNDILGTGIDANDTSFLPIAAAGRYAASEKFTIGADLGYGIGISPNGQEGAFYYRPMVGYAISDKVMLQASYTGMSKDGFTISNFGFGAMFAL